MSTQEAFRGNREDFFIGEHYIGGPKSRWKPIFRDGNPIPNAWEFKNLKSPNGSLPGFQFNFPDQTLADVYIELGGEIKWFTVMGGAKSQLDSAWKISKVQLYFNSPSWDPGVRNMWSLWEHGDELKQGQWYQIGLIPPEETPKEYFTVKKDLLKKSGIIAAAALGSVLVISSIKSPGSKSDVNQNSAQNNQINNPIITSRPIINSVENTQEPIVVPNPTDTPTPTETPVPPPYLSMPIGNQSINVTAGELVSGDIIVNGVKYSDSTKESGEIVEFNTNATVSAPFGATLFYNINIDINQLASQEQGKMIQKGCGTGNGCSYVDIIYYPDQPPQGQ